MSCMLFFLFIGVVMNLGMNCNDGIHSHFKVINGDFMDICNRVHITPINGDISDNIINDTIIKIQDPFYLQFDHIPIYPAGIEPLHMGIHIQANAQPNHDKPNDTFSDIKNYIYLRNCVLGTNSEPSVNGPQYCMSINSETEDISLHVGRYQSDNMGTPSFVNWTLYYSNEYDSMSYFRNNLYERSTPNVGFTGLKYLNIMGGLYQTKPKSVTAHIASDPTKPYTVTEYYITDILYIENIIISITETGDIEGFQDYILGNDIQSTSKHKKSFFNTDNIYQCLFYGLLGLIIGVSITVICCVCIKQRKSKELNNETPKETLLPNDDNNNNNENRISINS
mmetsp:Transcript_4773/g.5968  ORF Transcript_4773/g.5968 Transcript_4773/m.5968 type:complete len:338 (+) Transcript_4773:10-1023(+)